jgi:integrase
LNAKQELVNGGELSPRTFVDYKDACDEVIAAFGKGRLVADLSPSDFASLRNGLAKKWGLHRLAKTLQCVRCLFKFAYDTELVERPVRFGPGFKKPSKKTFRLHRAAQGQKLFTPEEIHRILAAANPQLKAMVLLGLNCGYGNADVGTLPISALDLDAGWADFSRPKTGMPRRCQLWSETVTAVRVALTCRVEPKNEEHAGLVFITSKGGCWHTGTNDSPLSHEVWKLLKSLGINGHRNFYALRHVFRTVADGAKDQPAADFIMGHEVAHMSSVYREGIDDERLKAVTDHVRSWLYPVV